MKNTVTEMKITLVGINSRLMQKNESAGWKTRTWKSPIQNSKETKELLKDEDSLRDRWDNIKLTNI